MCEFADALFVQVGNSESAISPTITPCQPLLLPPFSPEMLKSTTPTADVSEICMERARENGSLARFVFSPPRFIVGLSLSSRP